MSRRARTAGPGRSASRPSDPPASEPPTPLAPVDEPTSEGSPLKLLLVFLIPLALVLLWAVFFGSEGP